MRYASKSSRVTPNKGRFLVVSVVATILVTAVVVVFLGIKIALRFQYDVPFVISTDDRSMMKRHLLSPSGGGAGPCRQVLLLTSGGCHALDESLLQGQDRVWTCDVVPAQNHLLELKMAVIRTQPYETFWALFGLGGAPTFERDYWGQIRRRIDSPEARAFWDERVHYFDPERGGLYSQGSLPVAFCRFLASRLWPEGYDSWLASKCLDPREQVRVTEELCGSRAVAAYGFCHWLVRCLHIESLAGVSRSQWSAAAGSQVGPAAAFCAGLRRRAQVPGSFCRDYVTRLYVTGQFRQDCCPDYMKPENYERLRASVDRITILAGSMLDAMERLHSISRIYPLDHMDCLADSEVTEEARNMERLTRCRAPGAPIAVIKCVQRRPQYLSLISEFLDVRDVSDELPFDGSDMYMVQGAYVLLRRNVRVSAARVFPETAR
jgi:S-adenosylmethionine-diacylglycerol 3-amino-3-carboxypropyl transferase